MTRSDVSIVITNYNHARFLDAAIRSVLAQTVPPDEIIVVDDGSTEDPGEVVARHPSVRLIRQENQGLSGARNTGLSAASGRYVAFLDADDTLTPVMVEADLALFREHPDCAFVYGAYELVDTDGRPFASVDVMMPGDDAYASFLSGNLVGMHGTVLYRRDLLAAAGGFDRSLRSCEDYDAYLRLSRHHPVAATERRLASYRRHGDNMSEDVPRMLRSARAVLGRHAETARTRPEWVEAYRRGNEEWARYYVKVQAEKLVRAARNRSGVSTEAGRFLALAVGAPVPAARLLVRGVRRWRERRLSRRPVRFGDLDRTTPISPHFGFDRGRPVDRFYVEDFLARSAGDIRGRVLEIGDNAYTLAYGGDRVSRSDVLNRYAGHPTTTFVGDLSDGAGLPSDTFDCIVLTQTLHLLFDMPAAVRTLHRVLKPGGVLLVTVPWVSPIDRGEWHDDWCWSITPAALGRLLGLCFERHAVTVEAKGNVQAATAFLYGLADHELRPEVLAVDDDCCPLIVTGRAVKHGGPT